MLLYGQDMVDEPAASKEAAEDNRDDTPSPEELEKI